MAAICPTCQTKLSCGCQLKKASNGATVCQSCIGKYEADLAAKKAQSTLNPTINLIKP